MNILLHICCAPCAIEVIKDLRAAGTDEIRGFFYNPNIHPLSEFQRRKDCLKSYVNNFEKLEVIYPEYDPREFFKEVDFMKNTPERCYSCWMLRLKRTAEYASEKGFSAFTTTLLISPYQDQEKLKEIGKSLAGIYNLEFISRDFKKFYARGRKIAKELGLYRQNYCGCLFSELEKYEKLVASRSKI